MTNVRSFIQCLAVLLLITTTGYSFTEAADLVVHTVYDKDQYTAGDTIIVAMHITVPQGFHLYGNPLGPGIGKPLSVKVGMQNGVTWIRVHKQAAGKYHPPIGEWVWAYEKEAILFITGVIAGNAAGRIVDTIVIDGLICEKSCIPVTKPVNITVDIAPETSSIKSFAYNRVMRKEYFLAEEMPLDKKVPPLQIAVDAGNNPLNLNTIDLNKKEELIHKWEYTPQESKVEYNILLAIILAFLAGIILNIMPCVLPVLGIKILSFSQGAGSSRRVAVTRSLVFAAGMVLVFLVLASFAAFAGLSWGEQFQNPTMLVAIVGIIFIFALGMFDVFMILVPTGVTELERKSTTGKRYLDDFVKGMFTTILATPCSGPLLGATLAWTLMQKPVVIYAVFASIGLGMASPYVLFSASKRLLKIIPKPGTWMEDFKHLMGFLLLGFAVYLMIGLPKDMIIPTVGLCLVLAFAVMVYTRFAPFGSSLMRKIIVGCCAVAVAVAGWQANFTALYNLISEEAAIAAEKASGTWEPFTVRKLTKAHAEGRHVIVDFTANWCMNCQFNKVTVYHSSEVMNLIRQKNVLALKADLTQENPAAESLLHHLGSRSVPFLAVFPGDEPYNPVIMRDIVRKKSLVRVLKGLTQRE